MRNQKKRKGPVFQKWQWVVLCICIVAFTLISKYFMLVQVPSASMEPTIHLGSRLLVLKSSTASTAYQRNDVVVFSLPTHSFNLVKRIIALPGEKIQIYGGKVYINNVELQEDIKTSMDENFSCNALFVPEESYFVMGDNRNYSDDSRYWQNPYVHQNEIVGKVLMIF